MNTMANQQADDHEHGAAKKCSDGSPNWLFLDWIRGPCHVSLASVQISMANPKQAKTCNPMRKWISADAKSALYGVDMDLGKFERAITLAETRHFGHTRIQFNLRQSEFSRGVQSLDEKLGAELVHRDAQGAEITPFGAHVMEREPGS
jgi:hypothetical protein